MKTKGQFSPLQHLFMSLNKGINLSNEAKKKRIDTCKQISNPVSFLAGVKARPICFKQGRCEMLHLLSIFEGYLTLHQHPVSERRTHYAEH